MDNRFIKIEVKGAEKLTFPIYSKQYALCQSCLSLLDIDSEVHGFESKLFILRKIILALSLRLNERKTTPLSDPTAEYYKERMIFSKTIRLQKRYEPDEMLLCLLQLKELVKFSLESRAPILMRYFYKD